MKRLFIYLFIVTFLSCDDPEYNDLLPSTPVDVTIDLSLPLYLDLQIPGGWAYTPNSAGYGIKGIFLYNLNNRYVAYERACPHLQLSSCSVMTFDGTLLHCPCDDSKFNVLNGGASTTGVTYRAREYHVQAISATSLRITNF